MAFGLFATNVNSQETIPTTTQNDSIQKVKLAKLETEKKAKEVLKSGEKVEKKRQKKRQNKLKSNKKI